ncbi:MAG TPA: hypothetical protein VJ866_09495 [Pyrinomonadaceae bacterium]|nr:hypothetical protein [Pyrinomonadaceae bacterium]
MAYRGPTLIREPELRWPVILLAAAITSVVVLATGGIIHLAMTRPYAGHVLEQRLDRAIRSESPEFEQLSGLLVVEQLVAAEAPRPLSDLSVELTGTVRNTTGRTVTGLELRGVILDAMSSPVRERTVVVVPNRQSALEPGEAINVSILLEGVRPDAERAAHALEVTGLRFE